MYISKGNAMFNKMMSNSRKGHIIRILEKFDNEHYEFGRNIPLDMLIRKYYLHNRTVSQTDRDFINDQVYNLMRNKGLLDFLTKSKLNWQSRFETFYDRNFERQLDNVNIPS